MMTTIEPDEQLRVDAVIIPPYRQGIAFAHTGNGSCVTFTGEPSAMMRLCREHREHNYARRPPVYVTAADWSDVKLLERLADSGSTITSHPRARLPSAYFFLR